MFRRLLKVRILICWLEYHCSLALKDHYSNHGHWGLINCEIYIGSNSTVATLYSWLNDYDKLKVDNIYLRFLSSVTSLLETRIMIDITRQLSSEITINKPDTS